MPCSCCGPTTHSPQANAPPPWVTLQGDVASSSSSQLSNVVSSVRGHDRTDNVNELDISSEDCCDDGDAPLETPYQDDSCGSDPVNVDIEETKNNNHNAAPSPKAHVDSCCEEDASDPSKGKTRPRASAGGCCSDQSVEAVGKTDISLCEALKEPCCEKSSTTEASIIRGTVSSESPRTDCCSSTLQPSVPATPTEPNTAECCRGKPSPCCNESCLDRLALRECDTGSGAPRIQATQQACSSTSTSKKGDSPERRACDRHRRSVREQYAARLAALGCICRALLARGQESCCEPRRHSSLRREKCSEISWNQSLSRGSVDSCCASDMSTGHSPVRSINQSRKPGGACGAQERARKGCSVNSCCKPKVATSSGDCADLCVSEDLSCASRKHPKLDDGACTDVCSTPGKSYLAVDKKISAAGIVSDPEGQALGVEHVVLSVSGMTCTGCETKLNRALAPVAGVRNLKTSLVLSRAEFDVDLSLSTVDYVMRHLERTTEFQSEIITRNGSTMDVIVSEGPSMFANRTWPEGVMDISVVDKDIVRVAFDPEVVGARVLMKEHWAGVARLAPIRGDPALVPGSKHVRHIGCMTLLSAVLTIPVLVMAWAPIPEREIAYSSASLALATLVQVGIAGPFYPKALKALVFSRVIEMDLLIVLSTSAAYIFSVVSFGYLLAGRPLSTGQFFETSTLLVSLIMVGRYVAALARQKAIESISTRSLQTHNAILMENTNSEAQEIDVRLLQYGDIFKVLPDTRIPTDGTIISGSSEVNESMLTGESRLVEKNPKSYVIAGTINGSGTLVVRLTRLPGDNTINTIAAMVDEAKLSKPKIQELADKVSSYFVPVIIGLTIITFVVWIAVGIAVQGKTGSEAAFQAITYAITVLIVSCPCAIGLAVPMVVVIASGIASERGVIFKSADAIELAYKASHVVLDKTGTLTQGRLSVAVEHHTEDEKSRLSLLLGLISNSDHPVSVAVGNHLRHKGVVATAVPDAKSLTGQGVEARLADQTLQGGNARWLDLSTHSLVEPVLTQGYTAFCFAIDGVLCAVFGLEDSLRDDATHVVASLQRRGLSVHVVSGDDEGPVQGVAMRLGITESNVHARSSPADKQAYIKKLLGDCSKVKKPVVIFCGDGTNDAVALAQATIGIHINEGSDIAQSAADVVLMRPALSGLLTVIDASKVSVRRIKFNFCWSFVYNTFAVLLAAGAFVNARIPPEFAGLGELVSVLPVIVAAVLLRWSKV